MNRLFKIMIALLTLIGILVSQVHANRTVMVGIFQNRPIIFQSEDGDANGLYADLIKKIAEKEGWNIKFVFGSWAECLERLKTAEIDLMTSITYKKSRDLYMDFSTENILTMWGEVYVLPKSKVENITDLKKKKVAILKGGINGINFRKLSKSFNVDCEIIEVDSYHNVFKMVANKDVHAGVTNNVFGFAQLKKYGLRLSPIMFSPFDMLFAVPEGRNRDLLNIIDKYLGIWKQRENSFYYKTLRQWFGKGKLQKTKIPRWIFFTLAVVFCITIFLFVLMRIFKTQVKSRTNDLKEANTKLNIEIVERKQAGEELRESEERYRSLVEDQTELVCRFNSDGTFVFVNNAYCHFFETTNDNLIGKKWHPLFVDDEVTLIQEKLLTLSPSNPTVLVENRVFSGKGDTHWMQFVNTGFFDHLGNLLDIQSVGRDITERKRMEEELEQHRKHLEEIVKERTADLTKANQQLNQQIEERKKAGDELKTRTDELQTMVNAMAGRELRMAELKKVIKKLNAQLEEAGMTPVADDPLKEVGKDYT